MGHWLSIEHAKHVPIRHPLQREYKQLERRQCHEHVFYVHAGIRFQSEHRRLGCQQSTNDAGNAGILCVEL